MLDNVILFIEGYKLLLRPANRKKTLRAKNRLKKDSSFLIVSD